MGGWSHQMLLLGHTHTLGFKPYLRVQLFAHTNQRYLGLQVSTVVGEIGGFASRRHVTDTQIASQRPVSLESS